MPSPDAEEILGRARRPLVIGIGGGGDVVGALATAESCRLETGAEPILGGVTWERRVIDPVPGPRSLAEIEDARPLGPGVVAAGPDTRVRAREVPVAGTRVRAGELRFAETHMARFLGADTVLIDPGEGPARVAEGLGAAADGLGADLLVFIDVGGDALAHGDEPGLSSPLCDALLLAAGERLQAAGRPIIGGVFGLCCDGELTLAEAVARLGEVAAAGGLLGVRGLNDAIASRLEGALGEVPTEASALAVRPYRGERGSVTIRSGRRTVQLGPLAPLTFYFDIAGAVSSAARLVAPVRDAASIEEANEALHAVGVRSELDLELEAAAQLAGAQAAGGGGGGAGGASAVP